MGLKKLFAATLASGMILSFVPVTVMADSDGWRKDSNGWKYVDDDRYVQGDWKKVDGKWYYFHDSGYMISDVENFYIDGIYYAFDKSGACLNPYEPYKKIYGFHDIDYIPALTPGGELYYASGTCYHEPDGNPAKGWRKLDGNWYYFSEPAGAMANAIYSSDIPYYIEGEYYYFDRYGVMQTGWIFNGHDWFYANDSGALYAEKWLFSGGYWYYFDEDGYMLSGITGYSVGGIDYDFDEDGVCLNPYAAANDQELVTGWVHEEGYGPERDKWYYYDEDGSLHKGWLKDNGKWYYLDPIDDGVMTYGIKYIDDKSYYFDNRSGAMRTGWIKTTSGSWLYAAADGELFIDRWVCVDGNWYYIDFREYCIIDCENYTIDGIDYTFDSDGVCQNPGALPKTINGWYKRTHHGEVHWYYYDEDGEMLVNKWVLDDGNWYYLGNYGIMINSANNYRINGKYYDFDEHGVCLNPYSGRSQNDFS